MTFNYTTETPPNLSDWGVLDVRDGRVQVSMMDVDVFQSIVDVLSIADDARRGRSQPAVIRRFPWER